MTAPARIVEYRSGAFSNECQTLPVARGAWRSAASPPVWWGQTKGTTSVAIADTETTQWIRRFHPSATATTRLVCLPHAGGSASFYHPVSRRFAPEVDVVSIQYPGRQDRLREPGIPDIEKLADRISEELSQLSPKPTVLFGHSMGATIGFEVAHRLEQADAGPVELIASGRRAPSRFRADEQTYLRGDDGIIAEMATLNGTDGKVLADEEILRMSLPALRSDYRAIETYRARPGRVLRCPVTVLTGDADPKTTLEEAEAWREHTTGECRIEVYPGGHFFLTEHVSAVQAQIARALTVGVA